MKIFLPLSAMILPLLTSPLFGEFPKPAFSFQADEAESDVIQAADRTWVCPKHPLALSLPEGLPTPRGALVLDFLLPEHGTLDAPPKNAEMMSGRVFELPFLRGNFFISRKPGGINDRCALNLIVPTSDGKTKQNQLVLSRLEAGKPYQLVINWDAPAYQFTAFLQGIEQGDMAHWGKETPPMVMKPGGPLLLEGRILHEGHEALRFAFGGVRIFTDPLTSEQAAELAAKAGVPPIAGEGRTIYAESLDLNGKQLELIFEEDFTREIDWIHEEVLLDGEQKRAAVPTALWVLEGPKSTLECTSDGLAMRTSDPTDRKDGHWVLWLNKPFPDGILVEYEFAPKSDRKGLHILFLAAHNPKGESIFDLALPARRGDFRPYIVGDINSYHISPWAADDQSLRRTANMRKNSGFSLVAVGNDRIGGSGGEWHKIRALIKDGCVELESNGVLSIRFQDDAQSHGPIWNQGGLLGFRFMAHTEEAALRNLKVYRVVED